MPLSLHFKTVDRAEKPDTHFGHLIAFQNSESLVSQSKRPFGPWGIWTPPNALARHLGTWSLLPMKDQKAHATSTYPNLYSAVWFECSPDIEQIQVDTTACKRMKPTDKHNTNPSTRGPLDNKTIVAFLAELRSADRLPTQLWRVVSRVKKEHPQWIVTEDMIRTAYESMRWDIKELCTLTKDERAEARERAKEMAPRTREQRVHSGHCLPSEVANRVDTSSYPNTQKTAEKALAGQRKNIREENIRNTLSTLSPDPNPSPKLLNDELDIKLAVEFLRNLRETEETPSSSTKAYKRLREAFTEYEIPYPFFAEAFAKAGYRKRREAKQPDGKVERSQASAAAPSVKPVERIKAPQAPSISNVTAKGKVASVKVDENIDPNGKRKGADNCDRKPKKQHLIGVIEEDHPLTPRHRKT
ncbi:hypothetical protein JR316_0013238 [Psilocybe cubensis]|uniref:Uncharacterized protein n=1 Tax=Psilocybe cubensis TaxID=181762 RepID=A0ACB8GGQ2_PSICU|nr:hypothetical protein JR316_0013238 [Psilocybe cubensis]KAH9474773.1 hypothetical protein JR316_0013238 [Psilocybe cubensis]